MNLSKPHLSAVALAIFLSSGALILNGCQSTAIEQLAQQSHGAKAGDGYTYGTGPNKTKPYPQSEPVNINDVGGATPRFEAPSRGGNSDYKVLGQSYLVWTNCNSYQEVGTASWYGPGFHGNKTSNGVSSTTKRAIPLRTRTCRCRLTSRSLTSKTAVL